jgi:YegS/Rv2252/BmrU family lipid kinase
MRVDQVTTEGRPRRALLLLNPGARRGGEGIDAVLERLRVGGITLDERPMGSPEAVEQLLREAAATADCAIVGGGDGTLRLAAAGIEASGLPLGILPMGTANDLARTLGIPDDLEAAAEIILAGRRRAIDLGTVNGLPFFNVASIGLATELARALSSDLKKRWGRLGYAIAAMRALAKARRFTAWISENGATTRTRTMQIAVGNGRFYGGGNVVAAHATIDDGHLDLYSLELRTVWRLALMLWSFRSGDHGAWSEVTTLRGTEFEIRTKRPYPINADGEIVGETPAVFKVHPGAITVFVPPPAEPAPPASRASPHHRIPASELRF